MKTTRPTSNVIKDKGKVLEKKKKLKLTDIIGIVIAQNENHTLTINRK